MTRWPCFARAWAGCKQSRAGEREDTQACDDGADVHALMAYDICLFDLDLGLHLHLPAHLRLRLRCTATASA